MFVTRRQFLQRAGMGFGALSLAALLSEEFLGLTAKAAEQPANLLPRQPQFPAKAKHVVHIFAQGAPSHAYERFWSNALRWLVSEADEREKLLMCSINLSGQSLGDDKFLPFVIDQFHRSGLDARKICFEITETAAVASFSQANRFIQALKELGCKFALDDFGTGLSSFGYLKHFPVDFLKIDGSFVREILRDPIDREMVRSINEIGHLTGKQTIAEFAENAEIIQMLTSLGVDYAQGYGVAQPQRVLKSAVA